MKSMNDAAVFQAAAAQIKVTMLEAELAAQAARIATLEAALREE